MVTRAAEADLRWWRQSNPRVSERVRRLLEAALAEPFVGIGKPEPLTYVAADTWSRRITREHRLVYRVFDDRIEVLQARYHYSK